MFIIPSWYRVRRCGSRALLLKLGAAELYSTCFLYKKKKITTTQYIDTLDIHVN